MRESQNPLVASRKMRIISFFAIILVQLLYIPINRLITGGIILGIRWDAYVPFWPIFSIPYLMSILWWSICFLWAVLKMEDRRLLAFVIGILFMMITSYIVYIAFPTYVERPDVNGRGFQFEIIRYIYNNDRLNNAFPSGHTYFTVFIVLSWWKWKPRLRWIWLSFGALVIVSTLFTGQHNLLDPIGGIIWAAGSYGLGWYWAKRREAV